MTRNELEPGNRTGLSGRVLILEGKISVSDEHGLVTAGPGEIIAMQKGDKVTIRSYDEDVATACVTHPHWQQPDV